jgi:hypothetical protein
MDMDSHTGFVITAWRNSQELLQLRQDLYSSETGRKERAVNKVSKVSDIGGHHVLMPGRCSHGGYGNQMACLYC